MPGYDEIAEFYAGECAGSVTDDVVFDSLMSMMAPVAGLRILDLACGEGRGSRELARRGATVVGVDISGRLLAMATDREGDERLGVTYLPGDAGRLDWWDGAAFDGVVCNHALADIDDLDAALATVATVLRQGGRFGFAILHPCCPGSGPTTPSAWPPDRGYGTEGWWLADNPGMRGKVGSSFRRLSSYLNGLLRHGLSIVEVAEPASDTVPMFLVVSARRA